MDCHRSRNDTDRTRWSKAFTFLLIGAGACLGPRNVEAQLRTKVGSLIAPTAAAPVSQSITGIGFRPKAIIFFWTAQTAPGFAAGAAIGYGFTTGPTSSKAVAYSSTDNIKPNDPKRWLPITGDRCILVTDTTMAGVAYAQLLTMDADGFTLNWTRTGTGWIVHYIALGGSDIAYATTGSFTPTAGTGSQSVTGLAFQPDFLMFLSDDDSTGAQLNHAKVSLGYAGRSNAYGITQGASAAVSQFGATNILTSGGQLAGAAIMEKDETAGVGSPTFTAAVTSFDATGFTINKTVNTPGTETAVHYLALRGGQYRVGAIARPAAAGPQTLAYTGVGFAPRGLLFQSWNLVQQPYDEDGRLSFSAADTTPAGFRQRATFFHDKTDNPPDSDNSWVRQGTSGTNVANGKVVYLAQAGDCPPKFAEPANPMQCSAGPRVISEADVASYNADGFTLNWTANDLANGNQTNPGDETNAQILYVAFGNTVPVLRLFTKVGSLTAGTTNVTGVGFRPKAVIFYWTTQTANGFAVNASAGYGFATGAGSERAAIFVSDHDLAPAAHNSGNWQWNTRCIGVVINAAEPSTPDAEAQFTGMTSDGFTINWVNPPSQPWIIHYLALGGADITNATVGTFTPSANAAPETPQDESIAVGFQPDFLMFLSIDSTTMPTRASPDGKLTLGYAAGPNGSITQGTHAVLSRTGGANISTSGVQSHYDGIVEAIPGSAPPLPFVAAVKSFDANGFTITKKINYSPYTPVHYLALRGGRYKVGTIFRPATEGASTQTVTGVGFAPRGLLFSAWGEIQSDGTLAPLFNIDPIKDVGARINFSAVDTAFNARATFFEEVSESGADNDRSWVKQATWGNVTSSSKTILLTQGGDCQPKWPDPNPGVAGPMCIEPPGGGRIITDADLVSYDPDGFRINWTTNDFANANDIVYPIQPPPNAGDAWAAEIFYVAFGASSTTEVKLSSFDARGEDSAVKLDWQTSSELDNLGFHLYRSISETGPWTRITSSLIPGLGSSPVGGRYSYTDGGLTNGVRYYYQLEDVETTGRTERHGPVSAVPVAGLTPGEPGVDPAPGTDPGDGDSVPVEPTRVTYGDPSAVSLQVLRRDSTGVDLELTTGGFYAIPQADGSMALEIPGFELQGEPGTPSIPVERTFLEAIAGRQVRIVSVVPSDVVSFPWSRPALAGSPELLVGRDGTVRASFHRVRPTWVSRHPYPAEAAHVVTTAFQGETKKALLELAPLRWNSSGGQLLLARRLRVRVVFDGVARGESPLGGSRGRSLPRQGARGARAAQGLVAHLLARDAGLYAVAFEDVFRDRRAMSTSRLRLTRLGKDVPFRVEPDPFRFMPGSVLYFLSEGGSSSAYTNEAVYELAAGTRGAAMPVVSSPPLGSPLTEAVAHRSWEQNRYYRSGLLDAPDLWVWDSLLSGTPARTFTFTAGALATSSEPAALSVWLQGVTDFDASPDHHLRLSVNGSFVAEASWDGKTARRIEALLYPGTLHEGDNVLEIENVADTPAAESMVYLDRFALDYPHGLAAEAGRFEATFASSGNATLAGLGAGSLVLDTTDGSVRWLLGSAAGPAGLSFAAEAGHRYLAVSPQALLKPAIRWPSLTRDDLRSTRNQADYLLIAPRELVPAAAPLLHLREEQGLRARAVPLEEIYDAFGYGEKSPEAIRDFISYAYHHWTAPSPRYVLLLGDATFDPKDYAQTGVKDQLPVFMFKSTWLWTASDPAYASVNGDDALPDLAIGRLPASSLEQAQGLVHKLVDFERNGYDPSAGAVLVADSPDKAGDFEGDADDIAEGPLAAVPTEKIYLARLGTQETRAAILSAFDRGASLMSYVGHGGIDVWASQRVLISEDLPRLSPQAQQPLLFTMNCLNGYFFAPAFDSLAEALVKAEDKGAIAAISPSGLSLDSPAHVYHKALVAEVLSGRHTRLGDAILAAQSDYAASGLFPELLRVYNLLGDPAMRLE